LLKDIEAGRIVVHKRTDDVAVVIGSKGKKKDKKKKPLTNM